MSDYTLDELQCAIYESVHQALNEHFEATFRKRTAAMAMQAVMQCDGFHLLEQVEDGTRCAIMWADALVAELDK